MVVLLLHVRDGYLAELERYRAEWAPCATPDPDTVEVLVPAGAGDENR